MAISTVTSIDAKQLTKPQGGPKVGGVRSPHREGVADKLTPTRLHGIMRRADEGDIVPYLTLTQEMPERDPHYRSVLHTRKMAVSGIQPQLELASDNADLRRITDRVDRRIVRTPKFEGLIYDLLDGLGAGFSCVETIWQRDPTEWWPRDFLYREQRHFAFDQDTMTIPLLRVDNVERRALLDGEEGEPLNPMQWIVHMPKLASGIPIRTGLGRPVSVCYAAKRWTSADWMAFLDIFGVPIRLGKYPASMAEKKHLLLRAVQALGSDAAAVIPEEMKVELLEAKAAAGGAEVFKSTVEYWDKQTSKAVLGQTMSSDDGASLSQSKTHEKVRYDIRDADARAVCATINEQLIKPYVLLNFGEQELYPELRLFSRASEELVPLMTATKLFVDLGGRVQESEARDRLGYSEPEEGADQLKPTAKAAPVAPPGGAPGDAVDGADVDATKDPVEDDEEVDKDGRDVEANALGAPYDAEDEEVRAALKKWRSLADSPIGRAIAAVQEAETYDEARALLDTLAKDHGEVLDIGALVVSLSRSMLKLRGLGDATDQVKP